jgi:hypothetical protein
MFVNVLVAAASATTTFFVSRRKSRRNGENKTNFEQVCTRKRFLLRNETFLAGRISKCNPLTPTKRFVSFFTSGD